MQMMKNFGGIKLFRHIKLRKVLLVTQFSVSFIFIVSTVLLQKQTGYLLNFDFGFNKNNIVNIKLYKKENYQRFAEAVSQNKQILGVGAAAYAPATGTSNGTIVYKAENHKDSLNTNFIDIDSKCIDVWGLKLLAGKNLPGISSDSTDRYVLANESMIHAAGYPSYQAAIGQKLIIDGQVAEISGVVKDFQFLDLTRKIAPLILRNRSMMFGITSIKVAGNDIPATISYLERTWKKINPSTKFEYQFFDEQLQFTYSFLKDVSWILGLLSFLAVFISCLGLLGMAIYTAETRTKEIGVRKVLGSSVKQIIVLLSKNYFVLLLVAIFIATPIAYFLNNSWLEFFPYRVKFGIGIFAGSAVLLMMISLLIVFSQSYRASVANPIKSLRTE
jgi:putative ABC transport system permease protein